MSDLSELFKKYRQQAGVAPENLADYLGVTMKTLARYESGESQIPKATIYGFSNYLGISPSLVRSLLEKTSSSEKKVA